MKRMKRDFRIMYLFSGKNTKTTHNKTLYIKSNWSPPNASANMENRLVQFKQQLKLKLKDIINNTRPSTNISTAKKPPLLFKKSPRLHCNRYR